MNHTDMEKGIQDIQHIHLTGDERKRIYERVLQTSLVSPYAPTQSGWAFLRMKRSVAYTLASILTFTLAGGALAYAAQSTVPGDLLYPVKIHVTEPIQGLLAFTPEAQAKWNATKAAERLTEAETLANKNNLTPQYRQELADNFNKAVSAFNTNLQSIATSSPKKNDLNAFFNESMKQNSDIIAKIGSQKTDQEQHQVQLLEQMVLQTREQDQTATSTDMKNPYFEMASSSPKENMNAYYPEKSPMQNGMNFSKENAVQSTGTEEHGYDSGSPNPFNKDNKF